MAGLAFWLLEAMAVSDGNALYAYSGNGLTTGRATLGRAD